MNRKKRKTGKKKTEKERTEKREPERENPKKGNRSRGEAKKAGCEEMSGHLFTARSPYVQYPDALRHGIDRL